ncbi:MAG: DUF3726 domain-containing protein [Pseudomonadota bacterium]
MKTSLDEIRRMSFRALDAGRAPQGVDEDSAVITAWLEASGLPGLRLLGDALDTTAPKDRHATLDPQLEDGQAHVDAAGASAVFLGPGLIDLMRCLAASHGQGARLSVDSLRHAGFLIGFIGQAREQGEAFSMSPSDPPDAQTSIILSRGDAHERQFWARLRARREHAFREGIEVNQNDFEKVYTYSRKILVPETEQSRLSGAGAGLTDND